MIQLTEHRPQKMQMAKREIPVSGFIPYACHWNDETLLTKSGELVQMLRLDGFAAENAPEQELAFRKSLRNTLFKSIDNPRYALWFHTLRKQQAVFPAGEFPPGFAHDVNERWKQKNLRARLFENSLYISIVRQVQGGNISGFQKFLDALSHRIDRAQRGVDLARACQDLTDVRRRFETSLADYRPRVLRIQPSPTGTVSEPQAFVSRLLNLEDRSVLVSPMDISRYLCTKRLFFGPNAIECRGAASRRLAAILSIKEYGSETTAGLLDRLFELPFEWVLSQSFCFGRRHETLSRMQRQQRRLDQSEDLAVSQVAEISEALDQASGGEIAFGEHHLTLMPIAGTLQELDEAVAAAESEFINLGIMAVREDLNMEPCFWAQLPGNSAYVARRSTISTANLAGFVSLHNFPNGCLAGNHWGPAVTVLETQSGTPYFFNFHSEDVGHTTIIGPTGSGKTVLVNFLCAQAQKFRCRLFFFDKDRGAEIFLRAINGTYSMLGGGQNSGFNPLQLEDTPVNRAFLVEWLQGLLTALGETLTSEDIAMVSEAVKGNYKLAPRDRTLAKVAPFFGYAGVGNLAGRLSMWHSCGAYTNFFGGDEDVLSLESNVIGFEMGDILQNRRVLGPVLLYLFHRIYQVLDGRPTMIVLDEAWKLLDNPLFVPKIKDWLKTFRKQNALVVFASQSVTDASQSPISDTLLEQSSTHIYFPNAKATEAYRTAFKLSERELEIVRTLDPSSRYFLIKHGSDSVVAKLDLSVMQDLIPVLSGRAETVVKLDRLRAQMGEAPSVWLPRFLEETNAN